MKQHDSFLSLQNGSHPLCTYVSLDVRFAYLLKIKHIAGRGGSSSEYKKTYNYMSAITNMVQQVLAQGAINQLSKKLGVGSNVTQMVVSAGLPLIMKALSKNTKQQSGAESLFNAVKDDRHDGGILGQLDNLIGNPDSGQGAGILKHLLGGQQQNVFSGLSKGTGMPESGVQEIFKVLAPVVMGTLGKQQREEQLDLSSLVGRIQETEVEMEQQAPREMGFIGNLLDKDGDGRIDDDLKNIGMSVLGSLFK